MKRITKKNAILLLVFMTIGSSLFFTSCEKDSDNKSTTNEQSLKAKKIVITISWEKWGRKKKECNGAGLCYFKITIENVELASSLSKPNSAYLYYDKEENIYADILIDERYKFDEEDTYLHIDEDLYSQDENAQFYMIPAGEYEFNANIGKLGGYTIPVIIVK